MKNGVPARALSDAFAECGEGRISAEKVPQQLRDRFRFERQQWQLLVI